MRLILALISFANPACAQCLDHEQTFMSCIMEESGKSLRVCHTERAIHYRFGTLGQTPDLHLKETVAAVEYLPWPGVGRSIWEMVTFRNDDYTYEVFGGFERMFGEEEYEDVPHRSFGGVRVLQGEATLADLSCERATVEFAWGEGLFAAKENLGFVWNFDASEWIALPD